MNDLNDPVAYLPNPWVTDFYRGVFTVMLYFSTILNVISVLRVTYYSHTETRVAIFAAVALTTVPYVNVLTAVCGSILAHGVA